jgi:para-aminobenzoate synthetase
VLRPTPSCVFASAFAKSPAAFWLDSSLSEAGTGALFLHGRCERSAHPGTEYRSAPDLLTIRHASRFRRRDAGHLRLPARGPLGPDPQGPKLPFDFAGGFVGYFGYELKRELEGKRPRRGTPGRDVDPQPTASSPSTIASSRTWIVCLDERADLAMRIAAWMQAWRSGCKPALQAGGPSDAQVDAQVDAAAAACSTGSRRDLAYRELILRCQHEILQGETYEVCLTNELVGAGRIRRARGLSAAALAQSCALCGVPAHTAAMTVLCASPELFLRISGDRRDGGHPSPSREPRRAARHRRRTRQSPRPGERREDPRREPDDRRPAAQRPEPCLRTRQRSCARACSRSRPMPPCTSW